MIQTRHHVILPAWCSCNRQVTTGMPCIHMAYIAKATKQKFPLCAFSQRFTVPAPTEAQQCQWLQLPVQKEQQHQLERAQAALLSERFDAAHGLIVGDDNDINVIDGDEEDQLQLHQNQFHITQATLQQQLVLSMHGSF